MAGAIAQDRERCQIFSMDEKPTVVPVSSVGEQSGGMKGSLGCRSPELRASGTVGLRWQAIFGCQIVWNRSTRRAGARGGVGRPR